MTERLSTVQYSQKSGMSKQLILYYIGQNKPLVIFMPSQTPAQSALVMKPVSGVKPPMPIIMMSPASREDTLILGSVAARAFSASSAEPSRSSGFNSPPPCGATNLDMGVRVPGQDVYILSDQHRLYLV